MNLGTILICMTALAVLAVLWPLSRRFGVAKAGSDVEVYRDQLAEVERDNARGVIGTVEAEAARTEIARRLIAAADKAESPDNAGGEGSTRRRRTIAALALAGIPVLAIAVYAVLGRPDLPDRPLAARLETPASEQGVEELVARVEAELASRPEDGRGWDVLAPVYLRIGRAEDAATAYANAIRLLGATAEREAGHGEALTLAAGGAVTLEAVAAFKRAVAAEAGLPRARFYLGQAAEQAGDSVRAAEIYRSLLVEAPADAPWKDTTRQALAGVALGEDGKAPAIDPEDLAGQDPAQRLATIRGMVEGLETRLKGMPRDLPGQLRLIRAWTMLGERDRARQSAAEAKAIFSGDSDAQRRIDDLALGLGLEDKPA